MEPIPSLRLRKILLISLPLVITLLIWLAAKRDLQSEISLQQLPRLTSQLLGLWGMVLLSQSFILATKSHIVEQIYGGLDKVYQWHKWVSQIAFAFMLIHPILLLIQLWGRWPIVISLIFPFVERSTLAKNTGILGLYLFIILILITIFRRLPYHIWKHTHTLMGIPFILVSIHAFLANSDIKDYLPLQYWIGFWVGIGILTYIYTIFLYAKFGPKSEYLVINLVQTTPGYWEIHLQPLGKRLSYEPGEFVYLSVKNHPTISTEHHPFSIFSDPGKDELVVTYKEVGDYTQKLSQLAKGQKVEIFGPYGEFTSYVFNPYKEQVWIAGGIGITPFISMLQYEATNGDKKVIDLFYVGRFGDQDPPYHYLLEKYADHADDHIQLHYHCSQTQGRLSAQEIVTPLQGTVQNKLFLLCGPQPLMKTISSQLMQLGVSKDRIAFEKFDFV